MCARLPNHSVEGSHELYTLIEENKERLYRLAFSFVRNREEALDIVQETVYKAIISVGQLRQPQFLKTWLFRIAINCAHDALRKSKRVVAMEDGVLDAMVNPPESNREEMFDVRQAIERLDQKYKKVIILKFFEDMTLEDVAEILELPISTVKSRLYRGLEKLKIDLEEVEGLE
ncbi:sigma-70 family RNA polymerase sigma factor [Paenibacillus thiaminolyticus]|uniref:sigma-70 family RNA polymerase sigma factor n=1 Tax=Paenibacillus thiaminolyticus TaxID=49283 RepID=UPI00234FEC54|nr:sigma-70 family RNA polymerase sigma factor [Paenibacillus thiaminolyticus]WCR25821.1 sigma-70 family RNA polymerase sigma factor [Paenibacillus thiaminolyticus]